jgi:ubiquinone/menaquinone biosynthesis C-methylase UbiE
MAQITTGLRKLLSLPAFYNFFSKILGAEDSRRFFAERYVSADGNSKILDIGCGIKPYRHLFTSSSYTGIDIAGGGHEDRAKTVDAYYDGHNIPFPNQSFDTIICTQVL